MNKLTTNKTKLQIAILASMASLFVPAQSYALDLVTSSEVPSIGFLDIDIAAGTNFDTWSLSGDSQFFLLQDVNANAVGSNTHTVMSIYGANASDLNENSFIVDSAGDINLADGSVFVDRSTGAVGIGTSAPADDLSIVGTDPTIRLEDTDGTNWEINGTSDGGVFDITNDTTAVSMLKIGSNAAEDTLVLNDIGVGIGTNLPQSTLHVQKSGANLIVEDTNASAGIRTLVEMKNKGPVGFKLSDTTSSGVWSLRTGGNGTFLATKSDIQGPVLSFGTDGSVSFGQNPGSGNTVSNMFLSPVGDLTIKGSFMTPLNTYADYVFANDYKLMPLDELQTFVKANKHLPNVLSEAEVKKTNMINVSELQITQLAKIEELTLYTLQQHEQIKVLQEKDEQTIALNKKLDQRTTEQSTQIKSLKSELHDQKMTLKVENSNLKERLASLEKLVTNLAMGEGQLTKGYKLVLK